MRNTHALAIVEMLVVVAVVAVLTSILIVSLRGALGAATDTKNLANLRLTMVDFHAWSNDHDDAMVNAGTPPDDAPEWFFNPLDPHLHADFYTSQDIVWTRVLFHWKGRAELHWHAHAGPDPMDGDLPPDRMPDPSTTWLPSRFRYSLTMLTDAEVWTYPGAGLRTNAELMPFFRRVQRSAIAHPSGKGVLLHRDRPGDPLRWHAAFADGRSALVDPADARPPAASPFATDPSRRGVPVLDTLRGFKGIDF